jgi:predicted aspartyl protease
MNVFRLGALSLLAVAAASCRPGATRWEEFPAQELDRLVLQDFPLPNPRLDGPPSASLEASESGGTESHFFVKVDVNGVPASLLVDTGASRTLLFPALACRAQVGLAPVRAETRLLDENVPFNLGELRELRIGPLSMKNFQVFVARKQLLRAPHGTDPEPMDGMLGLDFLRRFAVTLDYVRRTVVFRREANLLAGDSTWAPLEARKSWGPFGLTGWTPQMMCRIDGAGPYECIFDSGASSAGVVVPRESWKRLGFDQGAERRIRLTLGGIDLADVPARAWNGDVVQFGPAVLIAARESKVTLDFLSGRFVLERDESR